MSLENYEPSRAQISRAALHKLHISMKHLFIRGAYKPLGMSGESMISSLLALKPEIYGSIADSERVELDGLLYIFQRLPKGIEECRYIRLISREGYENSEFKPIIPSRRKRNCYRVDEEQMFVEITRGSSDIYDILTHLTFMFIEAEKMRKNAMDSKGRKNRAWLMLEDIVHKTEEGQEVNTEVEISYLSTLLGRTYREVKTACDRFDADHDVHDLFRITYYLGKLSMDEFLDGQDREISFSSTLREVLGHHIYGEKWAKKIKRTLHKNDLLFRPLHIISANLHSVMNVIYAKPALSGKLKKGTIIELAEHLSEKANNESRKAVEKFALSHGMIELEDTSGTNIGVQIFDTCALRPEDLPAEINFNKPEKSEDCPVIIVMDYAFGEQAYESMDELLKPMIVDGEKHRLDVKSINIMGKAGILEGKKGDLMLPTAHVFEGTADNYPISNDLRAEELEDEELSLYIGPMITVLGTSLQNKDILEYFLVSSWKAVGLEMEGAHYQKAIQAAATIRHSIDPNVKIRYAYYASDNPLETGATLASGSLGLDGVKPTYLITKAMLRACLT
jgi:hypothetical protein